MSVEQIKREITVLSSEEQDEVTAFLFHLRHRHDLDYQLTLEARAKDQNRANWLTPEEFERRLNEV